MTGIDMLGPVDGDKEVTVTVVDRCTGCAFYDLDFSRGAFDQLADESLGRIQITWEWASDVSTTTTTAPTTTTTTPTTTTAPTTTPTTTSTTTTAPATTTTASSGSCSDVSAWVSTTAYNGGSEVTYSESHGPLLDLPTS